MQPLRTIDAHHHLWHYTPREFDWIDDTMAALRHDFTPADLSAQMSAANIDAAIAVQARQTLEETRFLLGTANVSTSIIGVVGWAPIASPRFEETLANLRINKKLVGLRHVVQAEPSGFLDDPSFNRGIAHLTANGLAYDILIYPNQLAEATRFVDRHPNQAFVLDHGAKPNIAHNKFDSWHTNIANLARRENVSCKLSGLVTEADWKTWSLGTLRPYLDALLETFSAHRLLAGSDWPVLTLASTYTHWWSTLRDYTSALSLTEQAHIFSGTAQRAYKLAIQETA